MYRLAILAFSLCVGILGQLSDAQAQVAIPNSVPCSARNAFTGQVVAVRQRLGPSAHWAHASWDQDGWPAVTYGPGYFALSPTMQRMTSAHECGHLVEMTQNEFAANCFALRNMPFSAEERLHIANVTTNLSQLPPQYGGSGAAFWLGTQQLCPDATQ